MPKNPENPGWRPLQHYQEGVLPTLPETLLK